MHAPLAESPLAPSPLAGLRGDAGVRSFVIVILAVVATIYAAALIVTAVDDADLLARADRIERDAARLERLHRPQPWLVLARAICCGTLVLREADRSLLFCDRLASALRHPSSESGAREYPWVNQFPGRRFLWHWRVREPFRVPPREVAALCQGLFKAAGPLARTALA